MQDRPFAGGTRLFARIRSCDIECPNCGAVWVIEKRTRSRIYNPRTGELKCPDCCLVYALGVLIYPISPGRPPTNRTPPDWTPTPRQAAQIRNQLANPAIYLATPINRGRAARNKAIAQRCQCRLMEGSGLLVHPGCPVHSANALEPQAGPPPDQPGGAQAHPPVHFSGQPGVLKGKKARVSVSQEADPPDQLEPIELDWMLEPEEQESPDED